MLRKIKIKDLKMEMDEKGCGQMMQNKNLEYYLDSRISGEELQRRIEQTKKQFQKKKIKKLK